MNEIDYKERNIDVIQVQCQCRTNIEYQSRRMRHLISKTMTIPVISDEAVEGIDLSAGETIFTGYSDMLQKFMSFKDSGQIELIGQHEIIPLTYLGLQKDASSFRIISRAVDYPLLL